jgi:para-nitrobenzyl esterase
MRWVQRNIVKFGGDPGNVTLFGESAGGLSVVMQMVSPAATGLFQKVIIESGVSGTGQISRQDGEKLGSDFSRALGCSLASDEAACMRSKGVDEIIDKAGTFTAASMRVVDGEVLPDIVAKLFSSGKFHRVPVLIGNNLDESAWFVALAEFRNGHPLDQAHYAPTLAAVFGSEDAARLIETEYPLANFPSPSDALAAAQSAAQFVCPARRMMNSIAGDVPVYSYEFMDRNAPQYFPKASFSPGATHSLELQYLFPRFHGSAGISRELSSKQKQLSDAMVRYWTNFAHKGDPNGAGLPAWPLWKFGRERTQLLDLTISTARDSRVNRKCQFWDKM